MDVFKKIMFFIFQSKTFYSMNYKKLWIEKYYVLIV